MWYEMISSISFSVEDLRAWALEERIETRQYCLVLTKVEAQNQENLSTRGTMTSPNTISINISHQSTPTHFPAP